MKEAHPVVAKIEAMLEELRTQGDSEENGRHKALVITNLEMALLYARHIYHETV